MTIIQPILIQVPEDRDGLGNKNMYRTGDYQKLGDRETKHLLTFDRVYYRYENGGYEGSGYMMAIRDGIRYGKDMSHCSCYGPTDDAESQSTPFNSFEECLEQASFTNAQKEFIREDYL